MTEDSSHLLEQRLLLELKRVNQQLESLALEKRSLERLIVRVRHEDVANKEVGRKNSAQRVLVERAVIEKLLTAKGRTVATQDLWRAATDVEFQLKAATFRSHLHRMNQKGLIEPGRLRGRWKLPAES